MEYLNKHRNISILFIICFLMIIYGFYGSYFRQIPTFNVKITTITHFHAITITIWLLLCIAQPLLIKFNKRQWHIWVGKFTYFYMPILVLGMVLIIRQGFLSWKSFSVDALAFQFIPISNMVMFITTYVLAILNRKNRLVHRSYMVVGMVLLAWTAFGRLNYGWLGIKGMIGSVAVTAVPSILLLLFLIAADLFQGKTNRIYVTWFFIMVFNTLYFYFGSTGIVWQNIARFIFE